MNRLGGQNSIDCETKEKSYSYSHKKNLKDSSVSLQVREILSEIQDKEVIAKGASVKIKKRLEKQYGRGNWIKMKGIARVRLSDGSAKLAEIHWFEAHGIGKKNIKVKYYLGE